MTVLPGTQALSVLLRPKPFSGRLRTLVATLSLLVGSKGTLYSPDDYGARSIWLPKDKFASMEKPKPTLPRSPGHHKEWILACKGEGKPMSNFDHAGPFTEFVLLGNVAMRVGKKFEWDAENLKAKNCPEADQFIRREYRKGWDGMLKRRAESISAGA